MSEKQKKLVFNRDCLDIHESAVAESFSFWRRQRWTSHLLKKIERVSVITKWKFDSLSHDIEPGYRLHWSPHLVQPKDPFFTRSLENVANYISAKRRQRWPKEWTGIKETYSLLKHTEGFQNTLMKQDMFLFGTKLSLLAWCAPLVYP